MTQTATGKSSSKATELRKARLAERQATVQPEQKSASVVAVTPIALDDIAPSPDNPRRRFDEESLQELADSIRSLGVLQPVLVRMDNPGGAGPLWTLVAGERRWRAARLAGLTHIPAVAFKVGDAIDEREVGAARLVENVQRADLTADEEAHAYKALIDSGLNQTQVAKAVGISPSRVNHRLKLLELPEAVQAEIRAGKLSGAHGEVLARWAEFPEFVTALAEVAVASEPAMSARELAHPFDFDNVLDDVDETLYEDVGYEVIKRAKCETECPFHAFVPDGFGRSGGWCLKPEHAKEIRELLNQENHAAATTRREEAEAVLATARSSVHAATHTPDAAADAPALPAYHSLPYGSVELLKQTRPLPAPCRAGQCACFGQVALRNEPWDACTQPTRLHGLQSKLKAARTKENARRHAEAIALVETTIAGRFSMPQFGVRELALIAVALDDRNGYRPNGTSWRDMLKLVAPKLNPSDVVEIAVRGSESMNGLAKSLVEAICRQDLALRFHPEGGRTYGALAEWYVGQPIPKACGDDWAPAEKGVDP